MRIDAAPPVRGGVLAERAPYPRRALPRVPGPRPARTAPAIRRVVAPAPGRPAHSGAPDAPATAPRRATAPSSRSSRPHDRGVL
ncbi:hypothetical protein [Streptomyces yaizuensis]|uniref:Uncharacterized protein n=1 Tax=Streptomyces yaizuensis TaxID=2989713 RepID=A0ABQ5NZ79_9ACTN|nr:hypothetical protein [Streptomyces sp. YSPA8]GLF95468.1 hypothetical protein SYYSPA8_14245 [Streptomyces sp. YSPA8]